MEQHKRIPVGGQYSSYKKTGNHLIMIKITFIFTFILMSICFFLETYHGRNRTIYVCANMSVRDPDKIETDFVSFFTQEQKVMDYVF